MAISAQNGHFGSNHETSNDLIPKMRPQFVANIAKNLVHWEWFGAEKQLVCLWRMDLMFHTHATFELFSLDIGSYEYEIGENYLNKLILKFPESFFVIL